MTRIKICGLTREEDALFAAGLGADFLGFIFVPESPRCVDAGAVAAIAEKLHGRHLAPKLVGVFRNADVQDVRRTVERAGLDLVQLHGSETERDIREIGLPAIKTIHVGESLGDTASHPAAEWLLFDTFDTRRSGGAGRRFDWALLATWERAKPFFLAGGLTPENVAAAISAVRPDAIDLASGIESSTGIKDHRKLETLFERVRRT